MSDINEISVYVTVKTAEDIQQEYSPPSTDDRPVCDLWSECNDPLCFNAGCRNVFSKQSKGVKS